MKVIKNILVILSWFVVNDIGFKSEFIVNNSQPFVVLISFLAIIGLINVNK